MTGRAAPETETGGDRLLAKLRRIMRKGDKKSTAFAAEEALKFYRRTLTGLEKAEPTPEAVRQRSEIQMLLGEINHILGRLDDALQEYAAVLRTGEILGPALLGEAHRAAGNIEKLRGNISASSDEYEAALEHCRRAKDIPGIADSLRGIGYVLWRRGEFLKAIKYYKEALTTLGNIEAPAVRGVVHLELGNVHSEQGELGAAEFYYRKALEELEKAEDLYQLARVHNNLGDLHMKRKQWAKAVTSLEKASDLATRITDVHMSGWALFNLAECYARTDRLKEAEGAADRALENLSRIDDKIGIASVFVAYGIIHRFRRDWAKSSKQFKYALTMIKNLSTLSMEAVAYREFGLMLIDSGQPDEGRANLTRAAELFTKLGARLFAKEVRDILSGQSPKEEVPAPPPASAPAPARAPAPASPPRVAEPDDRPTEAPAVLRRMVGDVATAAPGPEGLAEGETSAGGAEEQHTETASMPPDRLLVFVSKIQDRREDRDRRLRLYMELPIVAPHVHIEEMIIEDRKDEARRFGVSSAPAAVFGTRVFPGIPTGRDIALIAGKPVLDREEAPPAERSRAAPSTALAPHTAHFVGGKERDRAHRLFTELVHGGRDGVCIVRPPIARLQKIPGFETVKFIQVGLKPGKHLLAVEDLSAITSAMEMAVHGGRPTAVLIDCLDFLSQKNEFEPVLEFLRRTVEAVAEADSLLLVRLEEGTFEPDELRRATEEIPMLE